MACRKNNLMDEEIKFDEIVRRMPHLRVGEIFEGEIVDINKEGILVNIGLKTEGIVPMSEFAEKKVPESFNIGGKISVVLCRIEFSDEKYHLLSYNQAKERLAWARLKAAFNNNTYVEGIVDRKTKGGYIVDIGIEAFLPFSQAENIEKLIGKKANFFIINLERDNVVVSYRRFLEYDKKQKKEKFFATAKVGDTVEGIVTGITDFGAFVDIGGVEGLVHISDLAWYRVEKVSDILSVGKKVKLKILKIDIEQERIALGVKQLLPYPWDNIEVKYPVGSVVKGKVTTITNFGAFVELERGIEGLVHISEIYWTEHVDDLSKVLHPGDILDFYVVNADSQKEKITLSLKRLRPNPWEEIKKNYPPGSRIKGKVKEILPFGVTVTLQEGVNGLIHIDNMSWMKKIRHPNDIFSIGEEIECIVLDVDPQQEKVVLSLKHMRENPFEKYSPGKVIVGKVNKITGFGLFVELEEDIEGYIHISETLLPKGKSLYEFYTIGQKIEAKVIVADSTERRIELSERRLEKDREKELVQKYSQQERPKLKEVLEEGE